LPPMTEELVVGVGRDPVFGAVCLGRAEKGGVFILDAELSVAAW